MIRRLWRWLFPPEDDVLLVDCWRAVVAADPQVPKPRKL